MSQQHQTDPAGRAPEPAPASFARAADAVTAAGVYQLLGPLLAGRTVLEVWPLLADGRARLERAGAAEVIALAPEEPSLPLADGSVDVALCLSGFGLRGRAEWARWMTELRRVLQPEGLYVFRLPCEAGELYPEEVTALLADGPGRTTTVKETPFVGVSFLSPETEDMAIGGDLAHLASTPSHHLLFVSRAPLPAWQLPESLFIPLEDLAADLARRAALQKEVDAERDDLREALMALQDQVDRREAALAAFRRRSTLRIQEASDTGSALEALALERDQLEQRALRAEKAVTELEVAARRREVELAALETELSRLRDRPTPGAPRPEKPAPKPADSKGNQKGTQKNKPPA
jgi:hypothetical protein